MPKLTPVLTVLITLAGCSANSPPLPSDSALVDAGVDTSQRDAFTLQDVGGCNVQVTAAPRTVCNDDCTARLRLVSGDSFCTFQCATQAECAPYGLDCVIDVGACMPPCAVDADCPAGFYRCDPVAHFCDSYPT